jgi:hypothetical protein
MKKPSVISEQECCDLISLEKNDGNFDVEWLIGSIQWLENKKKKRTHKTVYI